MSNLSSRYHKAKDTPYPTRCVCAGTRVRIHSTKSQGPLSTLFLYKHRTTCINTRRTTIFQRRPYWRNHRMSFLQYGHLTLSLPNHFVVHTSHILLPQHSSLKHRVLSSAHRGQSHKSTCVYLNFSVSVVTFTGSQKESVAPKGIPNIVTIA